MPIQLEPFHLLKLSREISIDFYINYRSRRHTLYRFLTKRCDYLKVTDSDNHSEPVSVITWEAAQHTALQEGAKFIINFRDTRILYNAASPTAKPFWLPVIVMPHPSLLELCTVFESSEF